MGLESKKNTNDNLDFIDGLRGLAALVVLVGHARSLLWEGYHAGFLNHRSEYSILDTVLMYFFSLFKFGHEAVMLFFVISGFCIHLRYSKKIIEEKKEFIFNPKDYFIRRIRRLYPPLLVALFITFIFDSFGMLLGFENYSHNTTYTLINQNVNNDHSLKTLIGNLFFLMSSVVPAFGSNAPLWSLMYEWWFYVLYPACLKINIKSIIVMPIILFTLFIMKILNFMSDFFLYQVLSMMIIWWFGVILADIYSRRIKVNFSYLSFLILSFPIISLFHVSNTLVYDLFCGLGFTGLISICFYIKEKKGSGLKLLSKLKCIGDISYTNYVIHFPILYFLSGYLIHNNVTLPRNFHWVTFGVVFCLFISYILHFFIEKPFKSKS